jgi:ribosome biogenesis GTPase
MTWLNPDVGRPSARPGYPEVAMNTSTGPSAAGSHRREQAAATELAGLSIRDLGWSAEREAAFVAHAAGDLVPGRVVGSGGVMMALTPYGPTEVVLQRRTRRTAVDAADLPVVGDWLALEPVSTTPSASALRAILPRAGVLARTRPSDDRPQVVAANVEIAFLVSGLDHDLNLRRLERYLAVAFSGWVTPVVVLNKADIAFDLERAVNDVHRIAAGTRVIVASAVAGTGLAELRALLPSGTTACLLGSSGVGKSTVANALLGRQRQAVRAIRDDDSRGRHTTTRRELFALPGAGLLIDTPGMRAVGMLGEPAALAASFADVEGLAKGCRFGDCRHAGEPGCAVQAALVGGTLSGDRLASHRRLEAERRWVESRSDIRARRDSERRLGRLYRVASKVAYRSKHADD